MGQFENTRKEWDFLLSELRVLLGDLRVKTPFNAENGEIFAEVAEKYLVFA